MGFVKFFKSIMPEVMRNEGKRCLFKLSQFVIVKSQVENIEALAQVKLVESKDEQGKV